MSNVTGGPSRRARSMRTRYHAADKEGIPRTGVEMRDVELHVRGGRGRGARHLASLPPAILAQAAATLEAMFPGRFYLGLGAGEALNEHVVGQYWPEAVTRLETLAEGIEVIRKLFTGKVVKHKGPISRLRAPGSTPCPNPAADLRGDLRPGQRRADRQDVRRHNHRRCCGRQDKDAVGAVREGRA